MTLLASGSVLRRLRMPVGRAGRAGSMDPAFVVRRDLAAAEADWRELEARGVASVYQRYDWLSAWADTVGRAEGVEPAVLVAHRGGRPIAVWPFGITADGPVRVGRWLGDSHCNYHLGLFAPGEMAAFDEGRCQQALEAVARAAGIDAFVLERQPARWDDVPNPLVAALPSTPSASNGHACGLPGAFDELLAARNGGHKRKKHRQKLKQFEAAGDLRLGAPQSLDEAAFVLDSFFEQKAERFAAAGIRDCFAAPHVRSFFHDLVRRAAGADPELFELRSLSAGGRLRAIAGLSTHAGRRSILFLSYANDDLARWSPGEILVFALMEEACGRGLATVDFGVGEERYKDSWCDRTEVLYESTYPVTSAGWIYGLAVRTRDTVKRTIKQNAAAWDLYKKFRRLRGA
ncbi:GNAT family N-acetyltransferase [Prosthecomicrobium sp. N25]|uniref:GNAT family N-acetyltransferase n=1 Tax=Prosthecomicrobium sp. N25 TaxID=3129254 RepID=UPI003076DA4D